MRVVNTAGLWDATCALGVVAAPADVVIAMVEATAAVMPIIRLEWRLPLALHRARAGLGSIDLVLTVAPFHRWRENAGRWERARAPSDRDERITSVSRN